MPNSTAPNTDGHQLRAKPARLFASVADFSRRGKVVFGALLATLIGSSSLYLVVDYRANLREAGQRLEAMTNTAAEHVQQVFLIVDLGLRSVDDDLATDDIVVTRSREQLHQILKRAQSLSPVLQALGTVGTDGRVHVTAGSPNPPSTDLSDRDYFIEHRNNPSTGLIVSKPVVARPQNTISIPVSRRLVTANQEFFGIVAARLEPGYFTNFFKALGSDVAALFRSDGTIIARHPRIDLVAAAPLPPASVLMIRAQKESFGVFQSTSPIDGVQRMAAFRRINHPDLIVAVSYDMSTIHGAWVARIYPFVLLLVGGAIFLCVVALFVHRHAKDAEAIIAATAAARASAERTAEIAIDAQNLAEESQHRKSEFLAHMSHEIRTPMNAIIGFSQMIEAQIWGKLGDPRYAEYSKDILYSAQHLLAVIDNVLDLSKLEAGKWKLDESEISLTELIASVVRLAKQRAIDDSVKVVLNQSIPDVRFKGDERSLRQILLNLVVNAIKFAGKARRVEIDAGVTRQGELDIAVSDHGIGMTPAEVQQVIKPFESLPSKESRKHGGTGLGLPISIAFTELHGGALSIDSKPGEGTTVHVRLPAWRIVVAAV